MKSILSKEFVYTPSFATDIRQTFKRVRAERLRAAHGGNESSVDFVRALMSRIRERDARTVALLAGAHSADFV